MQSHKHFIGLLVIAPALFLTSPRANGSLGGGISQGTASLSQQRTRLSATTVGNVALFGGGDTTGNVNSDRVDLYNASTNAWTTATLSQPRTWLAATSAGGKAFFAGGLGDGFTYSNVVDIYNLSTNSWSTTALSSGRQQIGATGIGTKAMFAGGF